MNWILFQLSIFRRSLSSGIVDLDCERLCSVFLSDGEFTSVSEWTRTRLCHGINGKVYCSLGEQMSWTHRAKGSSNTDV